MWISIHQLIDELLPILAMLLQHQEVTSIHSDESVK